MAKAKAIERVPKVLREEAKAEEAEVTAKEAQAIVDELTAKQEADNAETQKQVAKAFEHDPAVALHPHVDSTRRLDYTAVPEHFYMPDGEKRRLKDPNKAYRWGRHGKSVQGDKMPTHHMRGWRPASYNPTFTGTGLFQQSPENWIMNGDVILMEISQDGLARLQEEIRLKTENLSRAVEGELAGQGQRAGVQTFNVDKASGKRELH